MTVSSANERRQGMNPLIPLAGAAAGAGIGGYGIGRPANSKDFLKALSEESDKFEKMADKIKDATAEQKNSIKEALEKLADKTVDTKAEEILKKTYKEATEVSVKSFLELGKAKNLLISKKLLIQKQGKFQSMNSFLLN